MILPSASPLSLLLGLAAAAAYAVPAVAAARLERAAALATTTFLGAALALDWDTNTGGNAAAVYGKADPNYAGKGRPVTADSIFKLARQCGPGEIAAKLKAFVDSPPE